MPSNSFKEKKVTYGDALKQHQRISSENISSINESAETPLREGSIMITVHAPGYMVENSMMYTFREGSVPVHGKMSIDHGGWGWLERSL